MGSLAMDQSQDIALGYSLSSSSIFPTIMYTGRQVTDPAGTMESEAQIFAGTGSQTDTSNRWGDYTSMAIDAADDCTFWYTNQYYVTTASFDWSTRLASFKFNNCGSSGGPFFTVSATPSSQTVNQGQSTTFTATVTPQNGYTGNVTMSVNGLPSGASGSFSPNPVIITSGAQNSTLTINTGTAAAGTYTLSIVGTDGSLTNSTTVTLTINQGSEGTLTPSSLAFGNQVVNTTSSVKKITLKSTGGLTLNISSISITGTNAGDFAQTNNCPAALTVGHTCTINVTFTPSALGSESAAVSVSDDAVDSPQTASLTGKGVLAATLTPAATNFGNVAEGVASPAHNFSLTNNQTVNLNISSITTGNPDFAETDSCGGVVLPKKICVLHVTFTPSTLTTETGTLTVNDDASNSPQTASLTGKGVPQVTLLPASLVFGTIKVGNSSVAKNVTLTNNLPTSLAVAISFTGSNPGDFTETDTCGGSVAAHAHCTISVTFKPTATGSRSATLTATDTANNSPQTVSLTGTGK